MMTLTTNQAAIEQRRRIADMMMQQGQEPLPTTLEAGGYVVPVSPLAGLSKIAQSLAGAYIGKKADEHAAAIEQAHNDILSKIDFNALDAPQKLAAAGMTKEAVALKMQQAKAQEGNKESFLLGYDSHGNPFRFSKTRGTGGSVPDEITGKMLTGSALYSPEAVASRERAKQLEHINNVELPTGAKQIMPNYQAMGVQPIVNGIAQVESSNNPNAVNPLPDSTSKGLYGFTDATRADAGLTGATPEQETAVMNELHKARMERYNGNEDLAILSHNIGITGADEVATGKRQLTPENIAYINKVRGNAVVGQTPAQKEASLLPVKQQEEINKKQVEINAKAQEAQQQEQLGANKTEDTLGLTYKYLYPNGLPVRDKNGRLTKPSEQMVLGNSPTDRLEQYAHQAFGYDSQKAVNTNAFKRDIRTIVLDKLGGKLGNQISDADREFILGQVSDIEKAQHIDDVYESVAAIDDRIKMVQKKYGMNTEPNKPSNNGIKFLGFE